MSKYLHKAQSYHLEDGRIIPDEGKPIESSGGHYFNSLIIHSISHAKDLKDLYHRWTLAVWQQARLSIELRNCRYSDPDEQPIMRIQKIRQTSAEELLREKGFGYIPQEWLDEYYPDIFTKGKSYEDFIMTTVKMIL